jgi:predicted RNase H-like nuclease (RuvC/YqgF family)
MLTKRQIYELYYEGPEATVRLIENLVSHLADVEKIVGHRQQFSIDGLTKKVKQFSARIERLKAELWKVQSLNFQLTRRLQELQIELERQEAGVEREVVTETPIKICELVLIIHLSLESRCC